MDLAGKLDQLIKVAVTRLRALSSMNATQHYSEIRSPEKGTFTWIFEHDGFIKTLDKQHSGIFHIVGKPGCGKTVLSKLLFRKIEENTGPQPKYSVRRVAFFVCNARDSGRRSPSSILGSLISQILEYDEFLPKDLEDLLEDLLKSPQWSLEKLLALFTKSLTCTRQTLPKKSKLVIIVDALDECDPGEDRESLLDVFQSVIRACASGNSCVGFLLTSRPYPDLTFPEVETSTLDLNAEASMDQDLTTYIHEGVSRLVKRRPPFLAYRARIIAKLQERAEKMFLLIRLLLGMMLRLSDSSPRSIEKLLASLPSSLSQIYDQIWAEIPSTKLSRASMIFSWLLCAFRPFRVSELELVLATHDYQQASYQGHENVESVSCCTIGTSKARAWYPLSKENQERLAPYVSLDLVGDLGRLFSPLIHISTANNENTNKTEPTLTVQDTASNDSEVDAARRIAEGRLPWEVTTVAGRTGYYLPDPSSHGYFSIMPDAYNMRINICHQTVKEHFLMDPNFPDLASIHMQMAEVCGQIKDGASIDGNDTESIKKVRNFKTTRSKQFRNYSEHGEDHRSTALRLNPFSRDRTRPRGHQKKYRWGSAENE